MRPLQSLEGKGFIELVQTAMDTGATHRSCSAESLIPSRRTVKRKMQTEKDKITTDLNKMLKSAINKHGRIGFTTDLCTDVKQRSYVAPTAHVVSDSCNVVFCLCLN